MCRFCRACRAISSTSSTIQGIWCTPRTRRSRCCTTTSPSSSAKPAGSATNPTTVGRIEKASAGYFCRRGGVLAGQLGAEHVDALDRRRLRQQLGSIRPQRLRDRPVEVSLATGFVGESIEDAERGRAKLQGKPDRGGAFLLRHAEAGL